MTEPTGAQFDAMREWLVERDTALLRTARSTEAARWAGYSDELVLGAIRIHYHGGVEQFLANHKEQGCA